MLAGIDAGHCLQNVYLYGVSANLSIVVRAGIDRKRISDILGLQNYQSVVIAQSVGYPE